MIRKLATLLILWVGALSALSLLFGTTTWSTHDGVTVGASTGNVSKWNGGTVGTSTGNINAWNNLASPGSGAALAYVNGTAGASNCYNTPFTSCIATYSPTATHLVICDVYTFGAAAAATSCTDNATGGSTTYTQAYASALLNTHFYLTEFYTCNVKSGVTAITANTVAATDINVIVTEYSGNLTSGCADTQSVNNPWTGTTATAGTASPASSNNEVITGFFNQYTNSDAFTTNGAYANRVSQTDAIDGYQIGVNSQIVASTSGTYAALATIAAPVSGNGFTSTYK